MATRARGARPRTQPASALAPLRRHPHLFQINTWAWLERLSRAAGKPIQITDIPDAEWDRLRDLGFDIVYLLGIWQRSLAGRRIARADPGLFRVYDQALPAWTLEAVVGSPFSIGAYVPDARFGGWPQLDAVRERLHARGMRLVLDFVPNHTGPDHPWVTEHPQYFIQASEASYRRDPAAFHTVERAGEAPLFIARGRDPYFAPWTDTAQLDHFNAESRAALIDTLHTIAAHCDGVRCDMAMLSLNDVFGRTWGALLGDRPSPREEFWAEAIAAVRTDFLWIAEVYWGMEARLQELGFDYTYDKRLYDRLLNGSPADVRAHLDAPVADQSHMARFIENHDEPRSVTAFGRQRILSLAALLGTVPGLRFWHDGQMEGRSIHLPMQLAAAADEPPDRDLERLHAKVLAIANAGAFHDGDWKLLALASEHDASYGNLLAYRWRTDDDYWLIVVNLANEDAHGRLHIADDLSECASYAFTDILDGTIYVRDREELIASGLYVRLRGYGAHVFRVEQSP